MILFAAEMKKKKKTTKHQKPQKLLVQPAASSSSLKFDPTRAENVRLALANGAPRRVACAWAQVETAEFKEWLRDNDYRQRIAAAEAQPEIKAWSTINTYGLAKSPAAAYAFIKRRERMREAASGVRTRSQLLVGGRPTVWSLDKQVLCAHYTAQGNFFKTACRASGLKYDTAVTWMLRGAEESEKDEPDETMHEVQFYRAIVGARDEYETSAVGRITRAGQRGNWKADAWMLTHGPHKQRFGPLQPNVNVGVGVGITLRERISSHVSALSDEAVDVEVERLDGVLAVLG